MILKMSDITNVINNQRIEKAVCTKELAPVYAYINNKRSTTILGHQFSCICQKFGTCVFFVPKEEVSEDSLEMASLKDQIHFGDVVNFEEIGLSIVDGNISLFNGTIYIKFVLKVNNIGLTALDEETRGFFHE